MPPCFTIQRSVQLQFLHLWETSISTGMNLRRKNVTDCICMILSLSRELGVWCATGLLHSSCSWVRLLIMQN
uniref:Uncharacterized protein n=1 Tax=Anguilla anguilla TaxID=7936 RepID=A0A0E9RPU9_ANGAN